MTELIPAPQPISTQEREFIASVEGVMRPAFLDAVIQDLGPSGRPAAELAGQMAAAAPGERLQRAVEATMDSSRHFDRVPAEERPAVAERAALAIATRIDARLTVEAGEGRLGQLTGRAADHLLRGQYETIAHEAGNEARMVLSGAINRAHFKQLEETQRHAGAGVTPPTTRPAAQSSTTAETTTDQSATATRPPENRPRSSGAQPHQRD
ncbi:hypothetical protein PWY87_17345 [Kribbella solani]|uniref:hypothetical protein n=1 Tax=Kribbella solani TaxID=236067 RepID=UPI0029AD5106|nr:hypothetical protein [Kribbella solani]MDX2968590.1 hypothetical protein [Kribbella solani]MDX3003456.1 hypothetical protein [Kribbella solani]